MFISKKHDSGAAEGAGRATEPSPESLPAVGAGRSAMFSSFRAARVFTADEAPADSIITHPDIHQRVCGSGATPMISVTSELLEGQWVRLVGNVARLQYERSD
jgi:hypothetical protein